MIEIDVKKCIGCGQCAQDCIMKNIAMVAKRAKRKGMCFNCGHCVAICPGNAICIPNYDMDDVQEYDEQTFTISPENFLNAVKFRRSMRKFRDMPLEKEVLEKVIQAGRYSATGVNMQDVKFIVLQDELEEAKELIWKGTHAFTDMLEETKDERAPMFRMFCDAYDENKKNDRLFFNAPAAIVMAANSPQSAMIAAANMEMMAVASGLSVLYDNYIVYSVNSSPEAKEWLDVGNKEVVIALLVGYPGVQYKRTAPRRKANIAWR